MNGKQVIGLTGGIGMGKSAMSNHLRRWGYAVIDTDQLARDVVEPGQPALAEIVDIFGGDALGPDGRLNRERLAEEVFGDATKRRRLEEIVHPRIRERWQLEVTRLRGSDCAGVVVVIPLLFETGAQGAFDWVLCVACSTRTQSERLAERGWTAAQAKSRIQAQWPVDRKMTAANHVIWTEGTPETSADQLRRVLESKGLPVGRVH